jgi:predicted ATPase
MQYNKRKTKIMIKSLHIENFKSHLDTKIDFANLNIITGMNGVGKSSLIQALLLLRQSYEKDRLKILHLVGDYYSIGSVDDAISQSTVENKIGFSLKTSVADVDVEYSFDAIKNLGDTYIRLSNDLQPDEKLNEISLFNAKFQYLSAFRNGPSDAYSVNTYLVKEKHQLSDKEGRTELIAHFIDEYKDQNIPIPALKFETEGKGQFITLLDQINYWMAGGISKNVKVNTKKAGNTSYKIEYTYNRPGKPLTKSFNPKNVGYGISYDLPIVTALLAASPGDLIIIENPEAHIHPSGQAKLMELICKASHAGVQIIIETHSDHIINGALVCCNKNIISHEEIKVYYFDRDEELHATKVSNLIVEEGGRIDHPPKGFFDQIDIDMQSIMGF